MQLIAYIFTITHIYYHVMGIQKRMGGKIHITQNELAGILSMGLEPMASSLLDSRSNQLS